MIPLLIEKLAEAKKALKSRLKTRIKENKLVGYRHIIDTEVDKVFDELLKGEK